MNRAQAKVAQYLMQGLMGELEEKDRNEINVAADKMRAVLAEYGDNARLAFTLVLTEMQANGELEDKR